MDWTAVLSGLAPVLGLLARPAAQGELGVRRRLRKHLELREQVPEAQKATLDPLIDAELTAVVARGKRRLLRRLDWANAITMLIVSALFGGVAWGLWQLDHWAWHVLAVVVGVFGFLLVSVGGLLQSSDAASSPVDRDVIQIKPETGRAEHDERVWGPHQLRSRDANDGQALPVTQASGGDRFAGVRLKHADQVRDGADHDAIPVVADNDVGSRPGSGRSRVCA